MMKQNLYQFIIILFATINCNLLANAQNLDNEQQKISIKPFVSSVSSVEDTYKNALYDDSKAKNMCYGFDLNYKLSEKVDIGLYSAYSKTLQPEKPLGSIGYVFTSANTFYYGINTEIHLIPLLTGVSNSKIDIYTILKAGIVSKFWHPTEVGVYDSNEWLTKTGFEFGIGVGVAYMITKKIGVFTEYNVGNYFNDDYTRFRAGIKLKL